MKVAKGYARNMLIPQLLALPNLDKYVTLVRKQLRVTTIYYATHSCLTMKDELYIVGGLGVRYFGK